MDDITALREQLACVGAREEIDLEALERVLKSAERYQWLRTQNWDTGLLAVVADPKAAVKLGRDCPSLDRLDEAIDAAIQTHLTREAQLAAGHGGKVPS